MCGITGWQLRKGDNALTLWEKTVMSITLAGEMESRGKDSFGGVLWFDTAQDPTIFKETGRIMLWGSQMLEAAILTDQLIIHTRSATTGAVTKENCHPFKFGKTIGVHNGVVNNHEELNKKLHREFQVDSQHLFAHIEEGRDINEVEAYGAVVFAQNNEVLQLAKFHFGTLSVARVYREKPDKINDGEHVGIIFASTQGAVTAAIERAGLFGQFMQVDEEKLYTLEQGDIFDSKKKFRPAYLIRSQVKGNPTCGIVRTMGCGGTSSSEKKDVLPPKGPERTRLIVGPSGHKLSKAERKAIKRRLRGEENGSVAARHMFNRTGKLQPHWLFENREGRDGKVYTLALCPDCNCDILTHHAGVCFSGNCQRTACPTLQGCGNCGCFLVDQTHSLENIDGVPYLYCDACSKECPIDIAKEPFYYADLISDDDEGEEALVVTTFNSDVPPPPPGVALVLIGGGKQEDTAEIDLTSVCKVTDDDLRNKDRLDVMIAQYRIDGKWPEYLPRQEH